MTYNSIDRIVYVNYCKSKNWEETLEIGERLNIEVIWLRSIKIERFYEVVGHTWKNL